MPVILDQGFHSRGGLPGRRHLRQHELRASGARTVEIGLVNNMPDSALESTERQFLDLLDKASGNVTVRLKLFFLPDVPRSDVGRRHVSKAYYDIAQLWGRHLEGLIVTGTEPRVPSLRDEPYWSALAALLDWADDHTTSTIASCLAAHAGVLHLDGVGRNLLVEKCSGVFDCAKASEHPLLADVATRLNIQHSRWNELKEADLAQCGYEVLTRSVAAGVDTFVKRKKSLFVFFQGHPEYDEQALLREYRRDIARFLRCERDSYPQLPQNYFDATATAALTAFHQQALSERQESLLDSFPAATAKGGLVHADGEAAATIYRRWLGYLLERKAQKSNVVVRGRAPRRSRAAVFQPEQGVS